MFNQFKEQASKLGQQAAQGNREDEGSTSSTDYMTH
jgi:hypothetical protein